MTAPIRLDGRPIGVTGGAGLIGSFLVEELVGAGSGVIVIDDLSKGSKANLADIGDTIELRQGDLEDPTFALDALRDIEVVFHLASRAYGVGYGQGHHLETLQHNERITNNVLEACARHHTSHLMIASSSCVYDDGGPDTVPELPLFDGEPEMVNWGYGWAKRFLEQKALIYSREAGLSTTIVRPFNIYGERYRWVGQYSQAIPMLVKRVMDGEDPVVIWGSGRQRRSYVHARDCARMMLAVTATGAPGPVNIGTEETIAVRDLATIICEVAGVSPAIMPDSGRPEGRFVKSADMSTFRKLVPDFKLSVTLREGLTRMTRWYRDTFSKAI